MSSIATANAAASAAPSGPNSYRGERPNPASVGNSLSANEQRDLIAPKVATFSFYVGEAVAYLDEQREARCVGIIKRKIYSGADTQDLFEVQINAQGDTRVFKPSDLFKFQTNKIEWQRGSVIGKGAYGRVWNGLNLRDGNLLAVKEMKLDSKFAKATDTDMSRHIGEMTPEITLMQMLEHPNIVKFLGCEIDHQEGVVNIFMERVSGGSIKTMLDSYGPLPESVMVVYTRQMIDGLSYLHRNGIVHRDLKGSNVLITTEGVVKLADFGVAKRIDSEELDEIKSLSKTLKESKKIEKDKLKDTNLMTMIGSPYWMAPEVVTQAGYGRKADVWSLGCTVIEMATAATPWKGYNAIAACYVIGESDKLPELPDHLSAECVDFISKCLIRDKDARPSADDLRNHPWLQPQQAR